MPSNKNDGDTDLPHINLIPADSFKQRRTGGGFGGISSKPVTPDEFRNMLGMVVAASSIETKKFKSTYFLLDLTTEYYTPVAAKMISELKLEIKTVLDDFRLIVAGNPDLLNNFLQREKIPKSITNPIKIIRNLDENEKLGHDLYELIRKDVDNNKIFSISISLVDNLSKNEEVALVQILKNELSGQINPHYLPLSQQFICGTTSNKITDISKIPFVKSIFKIPQTVPQKINLEQKLFAQKSDITIKKDPNTPVICVLDSGISKEQEDMCEVIDSNIFSNPYDTQDHGVSIASVALFGEDLVEKSMTLKQKSRLISVKIDDQEASDVMIEESLMGAINSYSDKTKIFTMSYNYTPDADIRHRIEIVKKLDSFIQENNVIVINSCGNISAVDAYHRKDEFPEYLSNYPVLSPSEAKNIFSVGSICVKSNSTNCELSRITRLGLNPIFMHDNVDKYRFFKPDIFTYGGNSNLEISGTTMLSSPELEIPIMTINGDLYYSLGTSIAAPLIALCFARLYQKYGAIYKNSETYKAIMLNKSNYADVNRLPIFYLTDTKTVANSTNALYIDFEGEIVPKHRSEDLARTNIISCKEVQFFMPLEAESIDIFTVHSNNYRFQDLRKYNTRLVVEIFKPNGRSIKKGYGTISRNCANTFAHYGISKNSEGQWAVKVHIETRGIPASELQNLKARFGVSMRINLNPEGKLRIREIYQQITGEVNVVQNLAADQSTVVLVEAIQ